MNEMHYIVSLVKKCDTEDMEDELWAKVKPHLPEDESDGSYHRGRLENFEIGINYHYRTESHLLEVDILDMSNCDEGIHSDEIETIKRELKIMTGIDFKLYIYPWYDGTDRP